MGTIDWSLCSSHRHPTPLTRAHPHLPSNPATYSPPEPTRHNTSTYDVLGTLRRPQISSPGGESCFLSLVDPRLGLPLYVVFPLLALALHIPSLVIPPLLCTRSRVTPPALHLPVASLPASPSLEASRCCRGFSFVGKARGSCELFVGSLFLLASSSSQLRLGRGDGASRTPSPAYSSASSPHVKHELRSKVASYVVRWCVLAATMGVSGAMGQSKFGAKCAGALHPASRAVKVRDSLLSPRRRGCVAAPFRCEAVRYGSLAAAKGGGQSRRR